MASLRRAASLPLMAVAVSSALALALALAWPGVAAAQSQSYKAVRSDEPLRDRIAYLLTLIDSDDAVRTALRRDPVIASVERRLAASEEELLAACAASEPPACPIERLLLTDAEIEKVAAALERLARSDRAVAALIARHLRPSGRYQLHAGKDDPALLAAAWRDSATALNRIYRLYALGEKPVYPAIDGLDRDPREPWFQSRLADALAMGAASEGEDLVFGRWSRMAIDLLILAQRDEAARYEPLESSLNGPANRRADRLGWERYRYTAILVPGNGLDATERGVSPVAVLRLRLAATRWRQGLAPLIIVSGGHVHPSRTPYAEAIEMRRALIDGFGVPAEAVLTDPYARHTTTNLRNAVRLLFRARAPMDRPFLVTSSPWQAAYVADAGEDGLIERARRELGYVPYRVVERPSTVDTAVLPDVLALQGDPDEPLDP